jgi:hypothetical protein
LRGVVGLLRGQSIRIGEWIVQISKLKVIRIMWNLSGIARPDCKERIQVRAGEAPPEVKWWSGHYSFYWKNYY